MTAIVDVVDMFTRYTYLGAVKQLKAAQTAAVVIEFIQAVRLKFSGEWPVSLESGPGSPESLLRAPRRGRGKAGTRGDGSKVSARERLTCSRTARLCSWYAARLCRLCSSLCYASLSILVCSIC